MEDDGLYGVGVDYKKYFNDSNAFPFLIRYKGELAGFFILRTYKRKGLGKNAAFQCFEKFKGIWEVHVLPGNETAYRFWRSVINEYTQNHFDERMLKNKNDEERVTFKFSSILK